MDRSEQLAQYVGAFFDELIRGGVRDVVISPGSRSTPLSMMAYASALNVHVDLDERGAAFYALGLAKATGRAVAVICTSGTAVANYYPAVLEAESSRVPLLVLSGDRPARLQQLGAPQTCDQVKIYDDHVRKFFQMPEVDGSFAQFKFARQVAREVLSALAPGTLTSAPAHVNFPFDEPLKPAYAMEGAFDAACLPYSDALPVVIEGEAALDAATAEQLRYVLADKRVIALCGEGTLGRVDAADPACWEMLSQRAQQLCAWAHAYDVPLLADPLSGLRAYSDDAIIESYDNIFGRETRPAFDAVIRFGRYPVSKRVFKALESEDHLQIVVDPQDSRDFNSITTTLVKTTPLAFVQSMLTCVSSNKAASHLEEWIALNNEERQLVCSVEEASFVYACSPEGCFEREVPLEGAYVQAALDCIPEKSLLFSANSMAIRAIDTFYVKPDGGKDLMVLANRGLNGIDGTLSSALGASRAFRQTYLVTGDLTLQHDLNALAFQQEFQLQIEEGLSVPNVVIILLNNGGGGIFELLPQKSEEPYFERLFLTPQGVDFEQAARAFGVEYCKAEGLEAFRNTLLGWNGKPGIHLLEVQFDLPGLANRYRTFQ